MKDPEHFFQAKFIAMIYLFIMIGQERQLLVIGLKRYPLSSQTEGLYIIVWRTA